MFGLGWIIKLNMLKLFLNKFLLLAGWEVRIGKNCDRGLENAARGRSKKGTIFTCPHLL